MDMSKVQADASGYLVDEAGKRMVFYTCNPAKNTSCDKTICRSVEGEENEAEFGFCSSTPDAACRMDGTRAFYKRLNDEGYFGREYIKE